MSALDPRLAALVDVSAALAARDATGLEGALERAARDVPHGEVEEALLQSHLFLGYPVALEAFALWRRVSGRRADPPVTDRPEAWAERGREVCGRVYGGQYGRLRENVRKLHPDLERWMVRHGYGAVLARPGLELGDRELCVVAALAVLDAPTQLYSHLRGALNSGVPAGRVEAALERALGRARPPVRRSARSTWRRVRARRDADGEEGAEVPGPAGEASADDRVGTSGGRGG